VLKQNRGSTGEGIWRVEIVDERPYAAGDTLPLDTKLKCTEAVDNHVEMLELGNFMEFCTQYIIGANGMLVDMRFMPRIMEGEIRILMVGSKPILSSIKNQPKARITSPPRSSLVQNIGTTIPLNGRNWSICSLPVCRL